MINSPEVSAPLWAPATVVRGIPRQALSEDALLITLGLITQDDWNDAETLRVAVVRIHDHVLSTPNPCREMVRRVLHRIEDAQAEVWLTAVQHQHPQ